MGCSPRPLGQRVDAGVDQHGDQCLERRARPPAENLRGLGRLRHRDEGIDRPQQRGIDLHMGAPVRS